MYYYKISYIYYVQSVCVRSYLIAPVFIIRLVGTGINIIGVVIVLGLYRQTGRRIRNKIVKFFKCSKLCTERITNVNYVCKQLYTYVKFH